MIPWLQDNPVGVALASACGLLVATSVGLLIFSAWPLSNYLDNGEGDDSGLAPVLPSLAESAPLDSFHVITERPVFNESRLPESRDAADSSSSEDEVAVEPGETPDVLLTGVVITPTIRMVTLQRTEGSESLVAFEGQPIEGEFSQWQVTEITPRTAKLVSGHGEELALELKVHDEEIKEPVRPKREEAPETPEQAEQAELADQQARSDEPMSRAEEIRQRIAERREELRRQAEEQELSGEEPNPNAYRDSIRSMMSRGRRQQAEQTNEEDDQ